MNFNVQPYQVFEELRYIIEVLVAEYMLFIPTKIKRRNHFLIKIIISSILLIGISQIYFFVAYFVSFLNINYPFSNPYIGWNNIIPLWYCFLLLLSIINLRFLFKTNWSTIIFRTTMAWSIQHIEYVWINETIGIGLWNETRQANIIPYILISIITCFVLYFFFYHLIIDLIRDSAVENVQSKSAVFFYSFFLINIVAFSFFCQKMFNGFYKDGYYFTACIFDILICFVFIMSQYFMLKFNKSNLEKKKSEQLYAEREKQLIQSQKNIDFINKKTHDLKHQISALKKMSDQKQDEALNDVYEHISFYDSMFYTNNKSLDTILTEKKLIADKEKIPMTVIADGTGISFMDELDIYVLLGNIIDNAIEASLKIEDEEKRFIDLSITKKNNFLSIQEKNYFMGSINKDINGKIITSKENKTYHGYGLESIKDIVKKYHGFTFIKSENQVFVIQISIPLS